jgi:hypothetical protein
MLQPIAKTAFRFKELLLLPTRHARRARAVEELYPRTDDGENNDSQGGGWNQGRLDLPNNGSCGRQFIDAGAEFRIW